MPSRIRGQLINVAEEMKDDAYYDDTAEDLNV